MFFLNFYSSIYLYDYIISYTFGKTDHWCLSFLQADLWNIPRHSNDSLHLRIHPHRLDDFTSEIKRIGASVNVFIDNIQRYM